MREEIVGVAYGVIAFFANRCGEETAAASHKCAVVEFLRVAKIGNFMETCGESDYVAFGEAVVLVVEEDLQQNTRGSFFRNQFGGRFAVGDTLNAASCRLVGQ